MAEQEGSSEPVGEAPEAPKAEAPPAEAPPAEAPPAEAPPAEAPPAEAPPAEAPPAEKPAESAAPAAPAAAPAPDSEEPVAPPREIPPEVLQRVGEKRNLEEVSDDELKAILKEYYDRWVASESDVYDISHLVRKRDMQIQELEMEVSDMRGKFIVPKLRKVHNFKLIENTN